MGTPDLNRDGKADVLLQSASAPPRAKTPFGFVGKAGYYSDEESGLQLLGHRYYLPKLGRFLTQDPTGHDAGLNLYQYASDNPVVRTDPDGLQDSYLGQSVDFFKGELSALNPVNWFKGAYNAADFLFTGWIDDGLRLQPFLDLGGSFAGSMAFWNYDDAYQTGQSFMNFTLILSRPMSKIPNPFPFEITGPYGSSLNNFTLLNVNNAAGKSIFRMDYGPLPANLDYYNPSVAGKTLPHYHRGKPDPAKPGNSVEGQGMKRHRPYERKSNDTSSRDRF